MMKVGITGGIGSGKSTVCRLFAQKGIAVYDSDAAAKRLMQEDGALRRQLAGRFGEGTFRDGVLDRAYLAGIVFADPQALADLNALVHPVVMRDFDAWAARQEGSYVILESAILFEAGLEGCVDKTVAVLAPRELRIERTCRRGRVRGRSGRAPHRRAARRRCAERPCGLCGRQYLRGRPRTSSSQTRPDFQPWQQITPCSISHSPG